MDYIKYAAFALSFISLVIEKFTKTSKDDESNFQKSTPFGQTLIFFSILTFGIGIWETFRDDIKSQKAQESAIAQRTKDSLLLAKRWEFDTLRFKQLLDTSEIIIRNSLNNLGKANKNLAISSTLLKTAELQQNFVSQNLALTKGLNYPLPYKIPMRYLFKYELDKNIDASLINYLDSISNSKRHISSDDSHRTSIGFTKLDFKKTLIIQQLNHYFRVSKLDFIKKREPFLLLLVFSKKITRRTPRLSVFHQPHSSFPSVHQPSQLMGQIALCADWWHSPHYEN